MLNQGKTALSAREVKRVFGDEEETVPEEEPEDWDEPEEGE